MEWIWMFGMMALLSSVSGPRRVMNAGEEQHHKTTFENEHVRLFAVEVAPGNKTESHEHDCPFVYVVIGDSEIDNHIEGTGTVRMKLTNGQVLWVEPLVHVAENVGTVPFRNVTVELKHPMRGSFPEPLREERNAAYSVVPVMERAGVRAYELTIAPGAALPLHSHAVPHIAVPVTPVELENVPANGEPKRIVQPAGRAVWVPAGVRHELRNVGEREAKLVVVEIAP